MRPPVKTPRTVSKVLPLVSISTPPEAGAVHEYQTVAAP